MLFVVEWIQVLSLYTLALIGVSTVWNRIFQNMALKMIVWSQNFPMIQNWLIRKYQTPTSEMLINLKSQVIKQLDLIQDEELKEKTKAWLESVESLLKNGNLSIEEMKSRIQKTTDELYKLMENYR